MSRRAMAVALILCAVVLAGGAACWVQSAGGEAAVSAPPAAKPAAQVAAEHAERAENWAKWGCIFAGLTLVAVLWMSRSLLRTIARNEVELAKMLQQRQQP